MNSFEALGFFYVGLAVTCFTAGLLYMAFCGVRQWIDDARTGATYRAEDETFRKNMRQIIGN